MSGRGCTWGGAKVYSWALGSGGGGVGDVRWDEARTTVGRDTGVGAPYSDRNVALAQEGEETMDPLRAATARACAPSGQS